MVIHYGGLDFYTVLRKAPQAAEYEGFKGRLRETYRTGSLADVTALVVRDSWRGQGLMNWLRGPQTAQAPRDTGFWGELAYRVERALRSRELAIRQEQQRLEQFLSAIEASPNGVMLLDAGGSQRITAGPR